MAAFQTPMSALGLPHSLPRVDYQAREREARRLWIRRVGYCVALALTLVILFEASSRSSVQQPGNRIVEHHEATPDRNGVIEARSMKETRDPTLATVSTPPPATANVPSAPATTGFRDEKQIVVLLTSTEGDAEACARTLMSIQELAFLASRVAMRVYEEIAVGYDASCVSVYCELRPRECRALLRAKQLRVVRRDVSGTKGISVARHLVESMVDHAMMKEHFYLSVDTGVVFTKHWDLRMLKQWYSIGNDRAILSVAPPAIELQQLEDESTEHAATTTFVQCSARIHSAHADAVVEFNPPELYEFPQHGNARRYASPVLQAQYSERFHFALVSTLLAVRSDPYLAHVLVGDEYMRATRFWTRGYDFYAPTTPILYHHYDEPLVLEVARPRDAEELRKTAPLTNVEEAALRAQRRIRRLLQLPVSVAEELLPEGDRYGMGTNRTSGSWRTFSEMDPSAPFNESTTNQFVACGHQLHYLHYTS